MTWDDTAELILDIVLAKVAVIESQHRGKAISSKRRADIRAAFKAGSNYRELAARFHCHYSTAQQICHEGENDDNS